ncbi:hypothetical protein HME9302_00235 [Alteripontixanthobacter maritimus]|uniref:Methyltransferase n=1 Tax=Alteripontixanthobacter maritimus TaxID=2161824 RepID=A0A369Q9U1_9SPHN|nr:class I SAM-dependent methyltransferase [Alteripontixanthobacter maritimus]RDC59058.1 hypothetical protein HME9302_00235 [Alteripontixanthobacter maritimus]
MRRLCLAAAVAAIAFAAPAVAEHHVTPELTAAMQDERRADDRARDQFRNPAETLHFFKVKPGMTVADVVPGGGWYTRVLVPYLGADGRYIGLNPDMSRATSERIATAWGGLAGKFPEQLAKWNLSGMNAVGMNIDDAGEDMAGTVDRVLIFREMHNLHRFGLLHSTLGGARTMLKDDGMLGIVQHRAKAWAPGDYADGSRGYMRQQDIIGMVEAHGFDLVATSEINANAKDTADHPRGVWEMPPSLGTERADLKDLGESDRMTLLFRKR